MLIRHLLQWYDLQEQYCMWNFPCRPIALSTVAAAQTAIFLAVSEDLEEVSGKYFQKCHFHRESHFAKDSDAARKLWKTSMFLTGIATNGKITPITAYDYNEEHESLFNNEKKPKPPDAKTGAFICPEYANIDRVWSFDHLICSNMFGILVSGATLYCFLLLTWELMLIHHSAYYCHIVTILDPSRGVAQNVSFLNVKCFYQFCIMWNKLIHVITICVASLQWYCHKWYRSRYHDTFWMTILPHK